MNTFLHVESGFLNNLSSGWEKSSTSSVGSKFLSEKHLVFSYFLSKIKVNQNVTRRLKS